MKNYAAIKSKLTEERNLKHLSNKEHLLVEILKQLPIGAQRYKLKYFEAFLDFLELLSASLVSKNNLIENFVESRPFSPDDRITKAFIAMLLDYRIVQKADNGFQFLPPWNGLNKKQWAELSANIGQESTTRNWPPFLRKKWSNWHLVNHLIAEYRNPGTQSVDGFQAWQNLVANRTLDYEIRLAETLKNLLILELPHKIHAPLDDSYYTESGRNAFRNFTRQRFVHCLEHINQQNPIQRILDIGCGYGNYIEALAEAYPEAQICGVELQESVYRETRERFAGNRKIDIRNQNIFDLELQEPVDLILLNYVLFYFSTEQKKRLFQQLYSSSSEQVSILVCQYYAGIEQLKTQLKVQQDDNGLNQRIASYYGDKILYANALWNEASDAFVQSEIWDEFEKVLDECGFRIEALTQADPFYYSLFIQIKKK